MVLSRGGIAEGGVAMVSRNVESSKGQQPEALRSLKTAARSGSKKPADQGLEAKAETAPRPASPRQKQSAAAEVLKAGVAKKPKAMEAAAKKAPSR
jgi:hypothetical protein